MPLVVTGKLPDFLVFDDDLSLLETSHLLQKGEISSRELTLVGIILGVAGITVLGCGLQVSQAAGAVMAAGTLFVLDAALPGGFVEGVTIKGGAIII